MESYAAELGPAREKAAQAREMYALAITLGALPARIAPADSYAVAQGLGGKVVSPRLGNALALDVQALQSARLQAVALLAQARAAVNAARDIAADGLRAAMAEAPEARRFFEATIRPAAVEEPAHMGLNVLGMSPVVGAVPDLLNAGWYSTEGRNLEAGMSLISAVPGVGDAVGGAVIVGGVATKMATRGLDRASLLTTAANEVRLGRGALDALPTAAGPGRLLAHVPYGFESRQAFDAFASQAHKALTDAGVRDGTVYLRGSSVTGYRYRTGESIATQGPGDLDLAVVSPELLEKARGAQIQLRGSGTRSMPLYRGDFAKMGLSDLVAGLTKTASRKVTRHDLHIRCRDPEPRGCDPSAMTTRYDRYGWVSADLDEVKNIVTRELNIAFEERWSDEWGGSYWSTALAASPGVDIVANFTDEDGALLEDNRPEVTVILDSTGLTRDQCDILNSLGGQVLSSRII